MVTKSKLCKAKGPEHKTDKSTCQNMQPTDMSQDDVFDSSQCITKMQMAPVITKTSASTTTNSILNDDESDGDEDILLDREEDVDEFLDPIASPLTQSDLLHRYLPNDSYNPMSMEETGTYHTWMHDQLLTEDIAEELYNYASSGLCLKHNVADSFQALPETCSIAGGYIDQVNHSKFKCLCQQMQK